MINTYRLLFAVVHKILVNYRYFIGEIAIFCLINAFCNEF